MPKTRRRLATIVAGLACVVLFAAPLVVAQESGDSQTFLAGFNAYQQKDYPTAVNRLSEVLQKHPETPLRDMTLFWLARAHYKAGNNQDAARYMAQFTREYPDNPLKNTVEDELLTLASRYEASGQAAAVAKAEAEASRQAEAQRLAQEQAAREAADRAEKARILKLKAEEERLAREKAEAERVAQLKLEEERTAKESAEQQRLAAAKAEAERLAREKAEAERVAQLKLEEERKAKVAAEQQRLAAAKAETERLAREKAETERLAKLKLEEERKIKEAAEQAKKLAAQKAAEEQKAAQKAAAAAAEQRALREKAISEYQRILAQFPGTPAAKTAAARLSQLGVAVSVPAAAKADLKTTTDNAQVLSLEVAQYAAFEFGLQPQRQPAEVSRVVAIPVEVLNRGNGSDSFYLASGFPAEFGARFVAAAAPDQAINQTPPLAPGERFNGLLQLTVPADTIDGLRITYPVKAASRFNAETSQSRELSLVASAPLLRAMIKPATTQAAPGERIQYRITVLNVGSMAAREVSLRLNFPTQYEPAEFAGFRQEMQAVLVQDGLALKSGESREFVVSFKLRDEALAREELVVRADLVNAPLKAVSTFHAAAVYVQPVSAVVVRMASSRVVLIPGQTITLPATVVNNGNQRERFSLVASVPPSQKVTVYHDQNRDGLRQPNEPEVDAIGPLGPKEEAALVLEVATDRSAQDGTESGVSLSVAAESGQGKVVVADARLGFSRPVVQLALKGRGGLLVPGELLTVDLVVHNQGSNLAKGVVLQAAWPEQLELVAAEPAAELKAAGHGRTWRLNELGAGEKRVVKASFRVKAGTGVGTGIQVKSELSYNDQLGNRY
ncbi:MAG: tetratricopeptide repeat protein [Geobacter sp.]|jgi:uncharacterized membrane protein